jgi:hypothetical protein
VLTELPVYLRLQRDTVLDSTALPTAVQDSSSVAPDFVRKLTVANTADMTPPHWCHMGHEVRYHRRHHDYGPTAI